jgi:chemotaxis protein methyltransferase CheR
VFAGIIQNQMNNGIFFTKEDLLKLINEFKNVYKVDFSDYADQSFSRRIEYILSLLDIHTIDDLLMSLRKDKTLLQKYINIITVNTTEMFRDIEVWHSIKRNILLTLMEKGEFNIWHAGCSTGEEVYSMLILLNEANLLEKAKIYATDINTEALEKAKEGKYNYSMNYSILNNFDKVVKSNPLNSEEILDVPHTKYFDFDKSKGLFQVKSFLREKVNFKYFDLIKDIMYLKFDLIFCRNVLIYFNPELQTRIVSRFHERLYEGGILTIGYHESISILPIAHLYESKIFRGCYVKKEICNE